MTQNWYCAGFLRNKEHLAIQHLQRQGYSVFCPRLRKTVSHARRKVQKLVPLFPGYLFVKLDVSQQRWRPIDGTIGVTHIVKTAGRPARVDPGFVAPLLESADAAGVISFDQALKPGDAVRAIGGPLNDQLGVLCRMKDTDRVVVLMSMLGRELEVTIPRSNLIKVA